MDGFVEQSFFQSCFEHDVTELEKGCQRCSTADSTPFNSVDDRDDSSSMGLPPDTDEIGEVWWSDVDLYIKDKKVLSDCWGNVPRGNVCAIMGPSGAGKTTLLNVIAGRTECKGCMVKIGRHRVNPVQFRKHVAFVAQDDCLMATSTPREALRFSAVLRLSGEKSAAMLDGIVDGLLQELGLTECADVIIGGALIKGISGGQRKRTSVGVELITHPKMLLLDEPTSGLDSHSASNLVKLLKTIAMRNSAILCTIHQPSSEVFALFDTVIFMKSGRVFYQGPVTGINTYFSDRGHKCPENFNPADFVMNLSQAVAGEELERLFMTVPEERQVESTSVREQAVVKISFATSSGFGEQIAQLTYREWTSLLRHPTALLVRYGGVIMLSIIFGIIFWQAGSKDMSQPDNFGAHVSTVMATLIIATGWTMQSAMMAFPYERPMFLREYSTGTYDILPYMLSKLTAEVPILVVQVLLQYMFVKTMSDLQADFLPYVAVLFLLALVSSTMGMLLGAAVNDVKEVTEFSVFLFVPQLLFTGFFTRISQIPGFLRWAQYLCGMGYGAKLGYYLEFNAHQPLCRAAEAAQKNCANLLAVNNATRELLWVNVICLVSLFVATRLLTAGILTVRAARPR